METVTLGGNNYRIGRLDVFDQLHISRKLMPLLANLGLTTAQLKKGGDADSSFEDKFINAALGPLAQTLADMSKEDVDFIVHTCLAVCSRETKPTWSPVQVKGGTQLMFSDIDLSTLMGLTFATIEENMGSFFPISQTTSGEK